MINLILLIINFLSIVCLISFCLTITISRITATICIFLYFLLGYTLKYKNLNFFKLISFLFFYLCLIVLSVFFKAHLIYLNTVIFLLVSFFLGNILQTTKKLKNIQIKGNFKLLLIFFLFTLTIITELILIQYFLNIVFEKTFVVKSIIIIIIATTITPIFFKIIQKRKKIISYIYSFFLKNKPIIIKTKYSKYTVNKYIDPKTNRPITVMQEIDLFIQSASFSDQDDDLVFEYLKYFRMSDFFKNDIKNALMIGGGGYSYPKNFLKNHPKSNIDVVEIDPKVTKIAKKYFNLKTNPRLSIYHQDGRKYLDKTIKKYDSIYIDAFNSSIAPYQLTTIEAVEKIYKRLSDNGIAVVNIVSSLEGEKKIFFQTQYNTYKAIFPIVYVFKTCNKNTKTLQNIIFIALKKNISISKIKKTEFKNYWKTQWKKSIKLNSKLILKDK